MGITPLVPDITVDDFPYFYIGLIEYLYTYLYL